MYYGLETNDFPGCCGINVISEFPQDKADFLEEEYGDTLTEKRASEDLLRDVTQNIVKGQLNLITLNAAQVKLGIEKVILKAGFTPITRFKNGNTGSFVTLYGKPPARTKKLAA